jgi:hypothetical protein
VFDSPALFLVAITTLPYLQAFNAKDKPATPEPIIKKSASIIFQVKSTPVQRSNEKF